MIFGWTISLSNVTGEHNSCYDFVFHIKPANEVDEGKRT